MQIIPRDPGSMGEIPRSARDDSVVCLAATAKTTVAG